MFEHGGNTNDCGCPIGNCDCPVQRAPEAKTVTGKQIEKIVTDVIAKHPNGIGGQAMRMEVYKASGTNDWRGVDNAIKRLKNAGVIERPDPKRVVWTLRKKPPMDRSARISELVRMILLRAPACPDPAGGGCIGDRCIRCAAREIDAIAKGEV